MASQLVRTLSPRPDGPPLLGTVRIPACELKGRVHELPALSVELDLVEGPGFEEASSFLASTKRRFKAIPAPPEAPGVEANRLWEPPAFLELAELGPVGKALCLGCGSGREAVWLAGQGWSVVAIDVLPDALALGQKLESRHPGATPIDWRCVDLRRPALELSGFNLIVKFFYLHRPLLARFEQWLEPGGRVVMETFSPKNREMFGKPGTASLLASDTEFPGLAVTFCAHVETPERYTTRIVAQKLEQ